MVVMIMQVNHRHLVWGLGLLHSEVREAPSKRGESFCIIPVPTSSLVPFSCLAAPRRSPATSSSSTQGCTPTQPLLGWIQSTLPPTVHLCLLCQREGGVQDASGFLPRPVRIWWCHSLRQGTWGDAGKELDREDGQDFEACWVRSCRVQN